MQDRQYLEEQLQELKQRKIALLRQKDIYIAEHNVYYEEISNQIDSIERHFHKCVEKD